MSEPNFVPANRADVEIKDKGKLWLTNDVREKARVNMNAQTKFHDKEESGGPNTQMTDIAITRAMLLAWLKNLFWELHTNYNYTNYKPCTVL